jgi:hypothetical protein
VREPLVHRTLSLSLDSQTESVVRQPTRRFASRSRAERPARSSLGAGLLDVEHDAVAKTLHGGAELGAEEGGVLVEGRDPVVDGGSSGVAPRGHQGALPERGCSGGPSVLARFYGSA